MRDILLIAKSVDSHRGILAENDSYAISPNWCHSTSLEFILALQIDLGGASASCTPEGLGWYLNF